MIKVLVADDEYYAREGMKRAVDWESLGCTLCGEAGDGLEGVEIAKRESPDIVITDIKMPSMSGLAMAEKIRAFLPGCKFIIITGYDELDYAKGAIKVNAFDFLLKPVDTNEFIESVKNASNKCMDEKGKDEAAREKAVLQLMRGKLDDHSLVKEELAKYSIDAEKIVIACIQNDSFSGPMDDAMTEVLYKQQVYIKDTVKKYIEHKSMVIECHSDRLAAVMPGSGLKSSRQLGYIFEHVREDIIKNCRVSITIGISNINSTQDIKNCYEEAKEALRNRLYLGSGSIIYYENIKRISISSSRITSEEKELLQKLRACDRQGTENKLRFIYFELFKNNMIDYYIVKQFSIEIIIRAFEILSEMDLPQSTGEKFDVYKSAERFNTIDELFSWVLEILFGILRTVRSRYEQYSSGIEKALDYIKVHYCEDISLHDVAEKVFLSESYLSRSIKKTTGVTFVDYIVTLRMERAMGLLKKPNVKVSDVALQVGYSDYRYFSNLFKKYTGYSPSDILKNMR